MTFVQLLQFFPKSSFHQGLQKRRGTHAGCPSFGVLQEQLLDIVDGGELADGGLGSVVGAVVNSDLAGSDLLLDGLIVLHGEGVEVPAVLIGGQTNVVAVFQTEVAVGTGDLAPLASLDVGQSGLDSSGQATPNPAAPARPPGR